jgi:hypothetical protein
MATERTEPMTLPEKDIPRREREPLPFFLWSPSELLPSTTLPSSTVKPPIDKGVASKQVCGMGVKQPAVVGVVELDAYPPAGASCRPGNSCRRRT